MILATRRTEYQTYTCRYRKCKDTEDNFEGKIKYFAPAVCQKREDSTVFNACQFSARKNSLLALSESNLTVLDLLFYVNRFYNYHIV